MWYGVFFKWIWFDLAWQAGLRLFFTQNVLGMKRVMDGEELAD